MAQPRTPSTVPGQLCRIAGLGAGLAALVPGLAAAAEDAGGLPQLDPATFPTQLVWLAISFVLLYFLLSRVTLPRVARVVAQRRDRLKTQLGRAENLRAETAALAAETDRRLAAARAEANGLIDAARAEANRRLKAAHGGGARATVARRR